jgi:hypothetical protein
MTTATNQERDEAMREWQPIETAPLDGSQFLVALTNGWVSIISGYSRWKTETPRYDWWRSLSGLSIPYEPSHPKGTDWAKTGTIRATHWMPLPPPPTNQEHGEG